MALEPSAAQSVKGRRVLIAEDEPAMANAIQRVLRGAGYETALAPDGMVTRTLLRSFQPELITLDLFMPNIDGIALLEFMRDLNEVLPSLSCRTLVVSGASQQWLQLALELGADAVLPKPFTNEDLLERVNRVLGGPRSERPTPAADPSVGPQAGNWREQAWSTSADDH